MLNQSQQAMTRSNHIWVSLFEGISSGDVQRRPKGEPPFWRFCQKKTHAFERRPKPPIGIFVGG